MGGVLQGVFGGGGTQTATQQPDEFQLAMNELLLGELEGLFQTRPYAEFARPQPQLATMTPEAEALRSDLLSTDNLMSLEDYINLGLDQTSNYISEVATPEIMSKAVLQGLEGGGFVPEAIARATAEAGLPFVTSIPAFQGAQSQQAQTLLGISDFPRALQEGEFLRQQGVVQTGLTKIPFQPGSTTKTAESQLPLFNLFGVGGYFQ